MNLHRQNITAAITGCVVLVACGTDVLGAAKPPAAKTQPSPGKPVVAAAATIAEAPLPKSVFLAPTDPNDGRNPFFPKVFVQKTNLKTKEPVIDPNAIALNGITSPPKPTAMINGRTFEQGEAGDIKLRNGGRMPVKVLEIRTDTVIIEVAGHRRELRLRNGI